MSPDRAIKNYAGIKIRTLPAASCFYRAGLRSGDTVLSVNGEPIASELDFSFQAAESILQIGYSRAGKLRACTVNRDEGRFLDIGFFQKPIHRCANKCIFCFIDQMPAGLRRGLYIKDEDLSHSFLNGNYVTLTNAGPAMLKNIVRIGLSPLFVSVHAADPQVRNRMLGIARGPAIMDQLSFLVDGGISLHTQIVVCPGYNDGAVLGQTIARLFSLKKSLLSIAVVPVGLTRFRSFPLRPVEPDTAAAVCASVSRLSDADARKNGRRRLFLADEFFLRAGQTIPPGKYYEEYPQIENGVGLMRRLLDDWKQARRELRGQDAPGGRLQRRTKKYLVVTSVSAYPFLKTIAAEATRLNPAAEIAVAPVVNRFFGESVTVAGLLSGRDVLNTVRRQRAENHFDAVVAPRVLFNYAGFTLDGYSARRLAKTSGIPFIVLDSIRELLRT